MSEPTEQQVAAAAQVLDDEFKPECSCGYCAALRKKVRAALSAAAPRQAEGGEPFREAYVEISQIVGRQGSEAHSLADDVRRLKAEIERLSSTAPPGGGNAVERHLLHMAITRPGFDGEASKWAQSYISRLRDLSLKFLDEQTAENADKLRAMIGDGETPDQEKAMEHLDAPMPFPNDSRLAEPDMTPQQIREWIEACNHEPARRVLRHYIALRSHSEGERANGNQNAAPGDGQS